MSFDGMRVRLRTRRRDYGTVPLPLVGRHQAANALLAVTAAEHLADKVTNFERAAETTRLPGRFDAREMDGKTVVFDVAHNDEALIAAAQTVAELSPAAENAMVIGVLQRKELQRFPSRYHRFVRRLHLVDPAPGESLSAPALLERFGMANVVNKGVDVFLEKRFETESHWTRFLGELMASPQRVVLVTGSFRTVEVFGRRLQSLGVA